MSERKLLITENNNKKQQQQQQQQQQQKCHYHSTLIIISSRSICCWRHSCIQRRSHMFCLSVTFSLLSLFILQFCLPVFLAEQFVFLPCRQTTSRRVLSSCHCIAVILYGGESEPGGSFYPHPEPGDWLDRIIREDVNLSQIFLLFKFLLFFSLFISVTEERITVLVWRICEQDSCQ